MENAETVCSFNDLLNVDNTKKIIKKIQKYEKKTEVKKMANKKENKQRKKYGIYVLIDILGIFRKSQVGGSPREDLSRNGIKESTGFSDSMLNKAIYELDKFDLINITTNKKRELLNITDKGKAVSILLTGNDVEADVIIADVLPDPNPPSDKEPKPKECADCGTEIRPNDHECPGCGVNQITAKETLKMSYPLEDPKKDNNPYTFDNHVRELESIGEQVIASAKVNLEALVLVRKNNSILLGLQNKESEVKFDPSLSLQNKKSEFKYVPENQNSHQKSKDDVKGKPPIVITIPQ